MEFFLLIGFILFIYLATKNSSSSKKITYQDSDGITKTEKLEARKPNNTLKIEKPENIEISEESREILHLLENTKKNVFMTGKAGTGKSTLLRYFRATTKKNHAVVAPTGIAAINVGGQTIHSFFGFGIDITPSRVRYVNANKLRVIRNLETLIIDEISMVRADLLDCIDKSLRINRRSELPFGGVQIIAIGDPYQLPPVVKTSEKKYFNKVYGGPHFFHSKSFKNGDFIIRELTKVHRQKDETFKKILNKIRNGLHTDNEIQTLNLHIEANTPSADTIKLVTTNALAKAINETELKKLKSKEKLYKAGASGEFRERDMPTEQELLLKEGTLVMLLNNDKEKRWVNGTTAKIISLEENSIKVKFNDNTFAIVEQNEWDNISFVYNEETEKIEPQIVGKFIQIPVKPAWAITIHKSQGQTYQCVHIDFGSGTFAPGQAYVALSRCESLEGLSLESPLMIQDIIVDEQVQKFMGHSKNQTATSEKKITTNKVTKSDINKLMSFMISPEKYATGTLKAKTKVENVINTFKQIKDTLDQDSITKFSYALEKYNKTLKK